MKYLTVKWSCNFRSRSSCLMV